jgi:hypothetical protein
LIIVYIDALHRSGDARADLMDMRGGVGVIGRFEIARVQPVKKQADQKNAENDPTDNQRLPGKMKFPRLFLAILFFPITALTLESAIAGCAGRFTAVTVMRRSVAVLVVAIHCPSINCASPWNRAGKGCRPFLRSPSLISASQHFSFQLCFR